MGPLLETIFALPVRSNYLTGDFEMRLARDSSRLTKIINTNKDKSNKDKNEQSSDSVELEENA